MDWGQLVMWEAVYDSGLKYSQYDMNGNEHGFKNMEHERIREFRLYSDGILIGKVNLTKDQRVVYRRLVERKTGFHVLGKWPFVGFNPEWKKEEMVRKLQPLFQVKCEMLSSQGAIKKEDRIFPHVNTNDGTFQIAKAIDDYEVVYLIGTYDKVTEKFFLKYIFEDGTVVERDSFQHGHVWYAPPRFDIWELD